MESYETYFNGILIPENIKINTKTMLIAVLEHEIWQKPVQPAGQWRPFWIYAN